MKFKIFKGKVPFFIVVIVIFLMSGCASMSTMQTARTTPKNDFGIGFGGGMVNSDLEIGTDTVHISAPFLEAYGRYGITDRLDMGLKLTIIGTVAVDVKYQFLGNATSVLAASIGGGLGYMNISDGDNESKIFDLIVPAYFSVHPAKFFGFYVSPKFIYRMNYFTNEDANGNRNSNWYGLTTGMRFGLKTGLFVEYSYFKNSIIEKPFSQVTCGISMGIL